MFSKLLARALGETGAVEVVTPHDADLFPAKLPLAVLHDVGNRDGLLAVGNDEPTKCRVRCGVGQRRGCGRWAQEQRVVECRRQRCP